MANKKLLTVCDQVNTTDGVNTEFCNNTDKETALTVDQWHPTNAIQLIGSININTEDWISRSLQPLLLHVEKSQLRCVKWEESPGGEFSTHTTASLLKGYFCTCVSKV